MELTTMISMVAFDFDGTIADTIPMCIEAFKKAVSPYAGHISIYIQLMKTLISGDMLILEDGGL